MMHAYRTKKFNLPIVQNQILVGSPYANDQNPLHKKKSIDIILNREHKDPQIKNKQKKNDAAETVKRMTLRQAHRLRRRQAEEQLLGKEKNRVVSFKESPYDLLNRTIIPRNKSTQVVEKGKDQTEMNFNSKRRNLSPYNKQRRNRSTSKFKGDIGSIEESSNNLGSGGIEQKDWICQRLIREQVYGSNYSHDYW